MVPCFGICIGSLRIIFLHLCLLSFFFIILQKIFFVVFYNGIIVQNQKRAGPEP